MNYSLRFSSIRQTAIYPAMVILILSYHMNDLPFHDHSYIEREQLSTLMDRSDDTGLNAVRL